MLIIKICLLGDGAVGKTSLRKRFMGEGFEHSYQITIGADFASKEATLSDGRKVKFQIWDLAGQSHFNTVRNLYFKGSMGSLAVYDVTRPDTLGNLENWCQEFWSLNGAGPRPVITLGNKADMVAGMRPGSTVSPSKGQQFADILQTQATEYGAKMAFYPTSARTGMNVEKAFRILGDYIIDYMRANPQYAPPTGV
ncbi:MAG: GTP-binding protein [Candidatus Thorarchaeota archaeon]